MNIRREIKIIFIIFIITSIVLVLTINGVINNSQEDIIENSGVVTENDTSDSVTSNSFSLLVGFIIILLILLFKTRENVKT